MLETRDVPTAFMWDPIFGTLASNPENWVVVLGSRLTAFDAAPGQNDDLYFAPISTVVKNQPPVIHGDADCDIGTAGSSSSYASIHLLDGYTHTVTLDSPSTTVGTYEQRAGFLAQTAGVSASQPNSLTVTSAFEFTGGTLNSTADLGVVRLQGATGTITPGTAGVTLGSTLNLEAVGTVGATLTAHAGIISVKNSADIFVGELCGFLIPDDGPNKKVELKQAAGETLPVGRIIFEKDRDALFTVEEGELKTDGGVIFRNGANVTLKKNWTVNGKADPGNANSPSVIVNKAKLQLKTGMNLTAANGLSVENDGSLWTYGGDNATITGNVSISGGTLWLPPTVTNNIPTQAVLTITGDLNLKADAVVNFYAYVDPQNAQTRDYSKIIVSGKTTIDAKASFSLSGTYPALDNMNVLQSTSFADNTLPVVTRDKCGASFNNANDKLRLTFSQ